MEVREPSPPTSRWALLRVTSVVLQGLGARLTEFKAGPVPLLLAPVKMSLEILNE